MLSKKYLAILKEFIYEEHMEKLAYDPNFIKSAYDLLLKKRALSIALLARKFKVSDRCAEKVIQLFKEEGVMDKQGKLVDHVVDAT